MPSLTQIASQGEKSGQKDNSRSKVAIAWRQKGTYLPHICAPQRDSFHPFTQNKQIHKWKKWSILLQAWIHSIVELRCIPSAMDLWASSSYCLRGRGKVGLRQLHHTLTYLLHLQDRQDQGTAGLEPRHELVLLYPPATTTSPPDLFLWLPSKLLAQVCVLGTPSWPGREVKASQPCACSSFPSTVLPQASPGSAAQSSLIPEGKKSFQSPVLKQMHIYFEQAPNTAELPPFFARSSQSLKLTGPGCWILLACILQSSHGSSSCAPLCKC